jgi:membrane associated rhomboid family serine protease
MSTYDREYMRDESRRAPAGPSTWSVVIWLVVVNVGAYLLNNLFFYNPSREWFGLSIEALASGRVWTLLTYQFIHANLWHLIANLLGLFFLGRLLLSLIPSHHVVRLYLIGGLVGGAFQLAWNAVFTDAIIIGASGSVLAIVIAATTLVPYQRIQMLLFFIIPVTLTMRQVAWILVAVNALTLLFGISTSNEDGVAVMAHFGGMFFGWLYITRGWHQVGEKSPRKKRSGFGVRILKDEAKPGTPPRKSEKAGPVKKAPFVTSDVDAILDKINEQGFQSLTEEEHRILRERSGEISRRIDRES